MEITEIKESLIKKNTIGTLNHKAKAKKMYKVYLDGIFAFSVDEEDYLRLALYEKKPYGSVVRPICVSVILVKSQNIATGITNWIKICDQGAISKMLFREKIMR